MAKRVLAAVAAGLATVSLGLSFSTAAEAKPHNSLKLIKTKTSLLGKHYWYQQTFKGLQVINGYYAKHVSKSGAVEVADGRDTPPSPTAPRSSP
jgi:Zn-dependent metalloprotease